MPLARGCRAGAIGCGGRRSRWLCWGFAVGSVVVSDTAKPSFPTTVLVQGRHTDQSGRGLASGPGSGGSATSTEATPGLIAGTRRSSSVRPRQVGGAAGPCVPGSSVPVRVVASPSRARMRVCMVVGWCCRTTSACGVRRSASGRSRTGGIRYARSPSCCRTAAKPAAIPVRAAISVVARRTGTIE